MLSRVVWLFTSLALIFLGVGCASTTKRKTPITTNNSRTQAVEVVLSPEQLEKRADAHAHFLAGLSHEQNREIDSALAEYEKALADDPRNQDLAIELSRRYVQAKDYDKAIAVLKKAADEPGAGGLMFARLSLIYLQQGKTNAAVEASRTAIKREPTSSAGYQSLFHLHRALGQTNEARKLVEQLRVDNAIALLNNKILSVKR